MNCTSFWGGERGGKGRNSRKEKNQNLPLRAKGPRRGGKKGVYAQLKEGTARSGYSEQRGERDRKKGTFPSQKLVTAIKREPTSENRAKSATQKIEKERTHLRRREKGSMADNQGGINLETGGEKEKSSAHIL